MACPDHIDLVKNIHLLCSKVDDIGSKMDRMFDPETGMIATHASRIATIEGSIDRVKALITWAFPTGAVLSGVALVVLKKLGVM